MADNFKLAAVITAVDKLSPTLKNIQRASNITNKAVRDIGRSSRDLFGSVSGLLSPLGAIAGVGGIAGIGAAVGKIVTVSAQFERFQSVLETVEGSAEKAKASMAWVKEFSTKTPYELANVTDAYVRLKAYGIDPQSGALAAAGDAAAAMNKGLEQAVEALADAMTGENERLKEFGIVAKKTGNQIVYTWVENGKTMAARADANNKAMIQSALTGIWNRRYGGAMDKLSGTWDGMWSNMKDQFANTMLDIGNAGVFDFLKGELSGVLKKLSEMAKDGSLKKMAETISTTLVDAFKEMKVWVMSVDWKAIGSDIRDTANAVGSVVQSLGGLKNVIIGIGALWLAGPLASIVGIVGSVWRFGAALFALGGGWGAVGTAMMAVGKIFAVISRLFLLNPIGLAVTAIAVAAYLVYSNWDKIKGWFVNFFNWLPDKIRAIAGWFKGLVPDWISRRLDGGAASQQPAQTPLARSGALGMAAGRQQLTGAIDLRFENAPPGFRVGEAKTNQSALAFNPDVGYRTLGAGFGL